MTVGHGLFAACAMLAAGAGTMLARRFDGVALPPWSEALAVALAGILTIGFGAPAPLPHVLWTMALILPLATLAAIDAATRHLPDILSWLLIALGLAHLVAVGAPVVTPALVAVVLVGLGLAIDRFAPEAPVGAGDFLIAAVAVIWLGTLPLIELALIAGLLVWLHFLLLVVLRIAGVIAPGPAGAPLGPALALALAALWIAAPVTG